jgi:hypothetical protein
VISEVPCPVTPAALRHTCAVAPRGPVALGEVAGLEWEGRWVVQEAEGCEAIIETRDRWILVEIRGKWTLAVPRLTCLALEEASEVCTTPDCTPTHAHPPTHPHTHTESCLHVVRTRTYKCTCSYVYAQGRQLM